MTCIVGIEDGGVVYMGGDSALTDADSGSLRVLNDPKVFLKNGLAIGCCASTRVLQLLQHSFDPPSPEKGVDDLTYLVTSFMDAFRAIQKKKGTMRKDGDVETHDSQVLLGFRGRLYCIEEDFQVYRTSDRWASVGSGSDLALGSMYSTAHMGMKPRDRIRLALNAAEAYNSQVRRPFHIIRLASQG